jgi:signal transduction histidine kinase
MGVGSDGRPKKPGLGVMGMNERAVLLGGRIEILDAEGGGTVVRAVLPKEQLI